MNDFAKERALMHDEPSLCGIADIVLWFSRLGVIVW